MFYCTASLGSCQKKSHKGAAPVGCMPGRDALKAKEMKRRGHLYQEIISLENLRAADTIAQKGKSDQYGVILHNRNREANIQALHIALRDKTYRTSPYHVFPVYEPKERMIYQLPYYPDRIVHHAIMRILEPFFVACFTADTYSCIKGKGIHAASYALRGSLRDQAGTEYCLQLDIRKFYPSVDHSILKNLLRKKFKDEDLLWLLEEIIDSAPGLPIGNYLSQYFANFYLTGMDHWLKEVKGIRYYFRYADDLIILSPDKPSLHLLRIEIGEYLKVKLRLEIKKNYRVFPTACGIDFVGYVHYSYDFVLLRPTIKKDFARMMAKRPNLPSFASYMGWAKHCNSNNLVKTLLIKNEKFQRIQYRAKPKVVYRRQDEDRTVVKPADYNP